MAVDHLSPGTGGPALSNRFVDASADDSRRREEKSRGSCGGLYPEIDYIDKVPYRVADTRGAVNGKDTGVEEETGGKRDKKRGRYKEEKEEEVEVPCGCMYHRVRARIGRKWSWERYRCVKAKTGFRGARPARWRVGVYKVFDTS